MKIYSSEKIRNVGFFSHGGAGKTTLIEAIMFNTGVTNRLGKVNEGNTISDYHSEEILHKMSINTSLITCEYRDTKLNMLDTPGFSDFFGDVKSSLRVTDTMVMVLSGKSGVKVSTEIIWNLADTSKIPRIAFINKLDRENADFYKAVKSMQDLLTKNIVPVSLPIGIEEDFSGIVNLINQKAYKYDSRGKPTEIEIPKDMVSNIKLYRDKLIEAVAEADDDLTIKYLEGESFTSNDIINGLKSGIRSTKLVPVLCGSALKNIACDTLLDFLVDFGLTPLDNIKDIKDIKKSPAALVFKTIADPFVGKISYIKVMRGEFIGDSHYNNINLKIEERIGQINTMQGKSQIHLDKLNYGDIAAISKLNHTRTGDTLSLEDNETMFDGIDFPSPTLTIAIEPKTKVDEDKLGNAIHKILDEDLTLRLENNTETKQTLLVGMGENHIDIAIEKLKNKFGVEVVTKDLKIPYRETITSKVNNVEGKHKKQSGGAGQFGHVYINLEPYPDVDLEFSQKIFGGSVPKQYFPAVEKGIKEAMKKGILAGYPVMNIKATLIDGSYHPVDSNEMAFKIAGTLAFKKACELAKPILLEPYITLEVKIPEHYLGDIIGDINSKRGRIISMNTEGNSQIIKATAPISEFNRYAIDLKSITHGRGSFSTEFSHYEELPEIITKKVIIDAKNDK